MVFFKFKRIFLTMLFILGTVTLLIGYGGLAGALYNFPAGPGGLPSENGIPAVTGGGTGDPADSGAVPAGKDGFFVEYRLQREKARGRQIELLREIINSPAAAGDTRQLAQEQLLGLSRSVTGEARVENLLKARGYREAVAFVDQKGVTVVVESSGLTPAEEAKIIELVSRETGFGEQSIVVIPKS